MQTRSFDVAPAQLPAVLAQALIAGWVLVSAAPHDLTTPDGVPGCTLYHCLFLAPAQAAPDLTK